MDGLTGTEPPMDSATSNACSLASAWTARRMDAPSAGLELQAAGQGAMNTQPAFLTAALGLPGLWAEERLDVAFAPEVAKGQHSPMEAGSEPEAQGREYTARLPGPMGLEIVARQPFHVQSSFCEGRHGWVGHCEVPPSRMRGLPGAPAAVADAGPCLWVIESGHLTLELPSGLHARFGPGNVLLWDRTQATQAQWDQARFSCVGLSPQRHPQSLQPAWMARGRATQRLDHLGLAPFLTAQLRTLAAHAPALSPADRAEAVSGIVQVAEALLRAAAPLLAAPNVNPQVARLQAVHRYIERNLHRADLSVADIAREASMSRAQLYRLFATQDTSVHGTLREKRLQKSMDYLKQPDSRRLGIGAIAYACGFSDPSAFSKLFRQRFHVTAREVRAAALAKPSAPVSTGESP